VERHNAFLNRPITRRSFVTGTGVILGSAYLTSLAGRGRLGPFNALAAKVVPVPAPLPAKPVPAPPDFAISAERDSDLLLLDFEFYGFSLEAAGKIPTLTPADTAAGRWAAPASGNLVVVHLPPQCIGEAEYFVNPAPGSQPKLSSYPPPPLPVDPPPVVSGVSGPSQLCFTLPQGVDIPLPTMTVDDLLDWSKWGLLVPATAQGRAEPPSGNAADLAPYQPGVYETAIEFPYALFISPVVAWRQMASTADWSPFVARPKPLAHATVQYGTIVDIWTAALPSSAQVAAVWATDYFDWMKKPQPSPPPNATEPQYIQYPPWNG
jgi:hypothetical protein